MIKGLNNLHLTDVTKTTSCNHEYQLTTIFEWVEWLILQCLHNFVFTVLLQILQNPPPILNFSSDCRGCSQVGDGGGGGGGVANPAGGGGSK